MHKAALCTIVALIWAVPFVAMAQGIPSCAGPAHSAHVARVEQTGTLVFSDGRSAALEGIRLPKGAEDHAPQEAARQALSTLTALVKDRDVTWATIPPAQDRHGRLRAQIAVGGIWVQEAILREGLARVALLPSHAQCATQLYAAEQAARAAKRGIWALAAYAVRARNGLAHDRDTFQIVEGKVVGAAVKGGRGYLNFSTDWANDFTVTIAPGDMKIFRERHVDVRDYAGKTVRVRGMIDWYHGPEIELMGPESVEVVK